MVSLLENPEFIPWILDSKFWILNSDSVFYVLAITCPCPFRVIHELFQRSSQAILTYRGDCGI